MLNKIILTGISCITLLLSGCAVSSDDNVSVVGNKSNTSNLKVSHLKTTRRGNLFLAQAVISNDSYSDKTAQVYYRCLFYDNQNFELNNGSEQQWVPVLVYANQNKTIQCSSVSPDAATFKVEISSTGGANKVYH